MLQQGFQDYREPGKPPRIHQVQRKQAGSNILCQRHNSQLSDLDEFARNLAMVSRESIFSAFRGEPLVEGKVRELDGWMLERWLMKTSIGALCANTRDVLWHLTGETAFNVPARLVRTVFGLQRLEHPFGCYVILSTPQTQVEFYDGMKVIHVHDQGRFTGSEVDVFGLRFVIWLASIRPLGNNLSYRPAQFGLARNDVPSQLIRLRWA